MVPKSVKEKSKVSILFLWLFENIATQDIFQVSLILFNCKIHCFWTFSERWREFIEKYKKEICNFRLYVNIACRLYAMYFPPPSFSLFLTVLPFPVYYKKFWIIHIYQIALHWFGIICLKNENSSTNAAFDVELGKENRVPFHIFNLQHTAEHWLNKYTTKISSICYLNLFFLYEYYI